MKSWYSILLFLAAGAAACAHPLALVEAGDSTDQEVGVVGSDVHIPPGRSVAHDLVRIGSNAIIDGQVGHDTVVINGRSTINGSTGHDSVVVLGISTINGEVGHDAVCVGGNLVLGPNAVIGHDVVCVGGSLTRDPHARIGGQVITVASLPATGALGLQAWWDHGLRHARLLGFGAHLAWLWVASVVMIGLYILCAAAMPKAIERCGELLVLRPWAVILSALITLFALPFVFVLLCITLVGIPVAFLVLPAALFLFCLFGRASIYALVGRRVLGPGSNLGLATLVGAVLALLVYLIPVLGLLLYALVSFLGLGCSVAALVLGRSPKPAPAAPVPLPPSMPPPPAPEPVMPAPEPAAPPAGAAWAGEPPPLRTGPAPLPPTPPVTAALPRAGFWIRILALAIDVIVVLVICQLFVHFLRNVFYGYAGHAHCGSEVLIVLAAYGALLWKLRGATIGGLVCNLEVVRLDGRPIDWATAIVRALGCFLSFIIAGLGFMWVAFDPERQSWHDKIAGTVVVRPNVRRSLV
jgi:uncharacterized RDD family membrane protein YckC